MRGSDSPIPLQATLAQLVEQSLRKGKVVGSSPTGGSIHMIKGKVVRRGGQVAPLKNIFIVRQACLAEVPLERDEGGWLHHSPAAGVLFSSGLKRAMIRALSRSC